MAALVGAPFVAVFVWVRQVVDLIFRGKMGLVLDLAAVLVVAPQLMVYSDRELMVKGSEDGLLVLWLFVR